MGQHLSLGHLMEAPVQLGVYLSNQSFHRVFALPQQGEDLGFPLQAVLDELLKLAPRLFHYGAVAGADEPGIVAKERSLRLYVLGHISQGGADSSGAGAQDVVAGEEDALLF